MMSSDDHQHMPVKPAMKDHETPGSSTRKTTSSAKPQSDQQQQQQQQQPALKCPRCDSPNTKFCYYNNYSLTQPRHFCKTCRRYWTKGGALRNVPIGGGCRKNKKLKSSSRISGSDSRDYSGSSSDNLSGGLKFFQGISPAMDFQLGGAGLSLPRLNTNPSLPTGIYNNQFSSFGDLNSATSLDPSAAAGTSSTFLGFNYPLTLSSGGEGGGGGSGGGCGFSGGVLQNMSLSSMNVHSSLASSIESLSSINQDLHWKLQQQRLAMLFGTTGDHDDHDQSQNGNNVISSSLQLDHHQDQQQPIKPILFQNLEISSKPGGAGVVGARAKEAVGDMATEWFFGNSYAPPPVTTDPTPTNSGGGGNGGGAHQNASNAWNGVHQAWSDLQQQYNALP